VTGESDSTTYVEKLFSVESDDDGMRRRIKEIPRSKVIAFNHIPEKGRFYNWNSILFLRNLTVFSCDFF
jgi:hypothetical protein